MKKNRIYFGLLILALVVTIVWTSAGMLGVNKEEKKYSVSVIVNDSNNDRWIAMREGLEFFLTDFESHRKLQRYNRDLNRFYLDTPALYEIEDSWEGFEWIAPDESDKNVIAFQRRDRKGNAVIVLINFSGVDYDTYRLGVDRGKYRVALRSDDRIYGGEGKSNKSTYQSQKKEQHGKADSISVFLPKLSCIYLTRQNIIKGD